MKKRALPSLALLTALLLSLLCACSGGGDAPAGSVAPPPDTDGGTKQTEASSAKPPADPSKDTVAEAGISVTPESMSDRYSRDGEELIRNSVNCPVLSGNDAYALDRINTALREYCEAYIAISQTAKALAEEDYEIAQSDGFDFEPHEKSADYTLYVYRDVLSVRFESYEQSGGADDLWETEALCFRLSTGERLSFADYIGKSEEFAVDYIVEAFTVLIIAEPDRYFDDALSLLPNEVDPYDFYLAEDGVTLFLNTASIAPGALGTQTLVIPYSNIPK